MIPIKRIFIIIAFTGYSFGYAQMLQIAGNTLLLKEPIFDNALMEVDDTTLRKLVFIKHVDPTWVMIGYKFGYNDAGLFKSHIIQSEKLPANHLKKALDTRSNRIYFNDVIIEQNYKTQKFSFVLKINYTPPKEYRSLTMILSDSATISFTSDSTVWNAITALTSTQWSTLDTLTCLELGYEILGYELGYMKGSDYVPVQVEGPQIPADTRDKIVAMRIEKIFLAKMRIRYPDGSIQKKSYPIQIIY